MARVKLSTLPRRVRSHGGIETMKRRVVNEGASNRYEVFDFIAYDGKTVFSVIATDCFDADGNFFEDDL